MKIANFHSPCTVFGCFSLLTKQPRYYTLQDLVVWFLRIGDMQANFSSRIVTTPADYRNWHYEKISAQNISIVAVVSVNSNC
ncbi:hypothetical protein SDJN02_15550 [Cucurbita argyrosperma subsp. argyrosperma]|nr:hypothetical protein SDJN02_15550 [Cucurbita argyrosperma subsp. argyrosperma]